MRSQLITGVLAGGAVIATSLFERWIAGGGVAQQAILGALVAGAALGAFGGFAAALLPLGDPNWGLMRGVRVVLLGAIGGTLASMWLFDTPTCTAAAAAAANCLGPGRKGCYIGLCGFLAENGFQLIRKEGRRAMLESLRRAVLWTSKALQAEDERP
jgi:hypothetical protein